MAFLVVCLAFVAVFVATYTHGIERRAFASGDLSQADTSNELSVADEPVQEAAGSSAVIQTAHSAMPHAFQPSTVIQNVFTICHTGGTNCVVDGDTAWIDGEKIRIADIDAPATHRPRCDYEAKLGEKATQRLSELMNGGPFELKVLDRDTDRYGRKLRVLVRDGGSLGDMLVAEGLARTWEGRRRPWC